MIKTDTETGIMYRQWGRSDPKAVLLLVHGLGAHSERWEGMAEFFARHGFSAYAIELKGFGETDTARGHIDSFNTYFRDIRSLRSVIARENSGKKIYLAGESLGALIAFTMIADEPDIFDGLISIAPAFKSRMALPAAEYLKIAFALVFSPKRQFRLPFDSSMCTRDGEYRLKMDDDEREHRLATAGLLFETIRAQARSTRAARKVKGPVLFLMAGRDKLTDPRTAVNVFSKINTPDKALIEYPGMYHSLTIDSGKEQVFKDILKWISDRTGTR